MKKRMFLPVIFLLTLAYGGISGCNKEDIVTPTETEVVEPVEPTVPVIDRFDGEDIYFKIGNTFYEGRVVEGVSIDEVLVDVTNSSDMIINIDRIGGTLIADHPDLEDIDYVILLGNRNRGERVVRGPIIAVYSDGMRKIELLTASLLDGTRVRLDSILFVHEDTDFEDGGYLTREEFGRLIDNGN